MFAYMCMSCINIHKLKKGKQIGRNQKYDTKASSPIFQLASKTYFYIQIHVKHAQNLGLSNMFDSILMNFYTTKIAILDLFPIQNQFLKDSYIRKNRLCKGGVPTFTASPRVWFLSASSLECNSSL